MAETGQQAPAFPLAHPPDKCRGPFSNELAGRTFAYTYPSGIAYYISFDAEHVYFNLRKKDGTIPSTYRKLPYKARVIRPPSLILAHWLAPRRQGHVALLFDLEEGTVTVAALMPQKFELFDSTVIEESYENYEGAIQTDGSEIVD
ncbi:hypothetical protein BJY01DRAFT_256400 [Aspergillus pseudoustus]|uniref:Uncharacterized protein n=1 Tax=Aspergillus pseudoustus TaxID=1810923 RepID=A0ABR4IAP8_9EURO